MDRGIAEDLARRLAGLRRDAEALAREGEAQGFPAVWRNALRVMATIRMMEIDLGLATVADRDRLMKRPS